MDVAGSLIPVVSFHASETRIEVLAEVALVAVLTLEARAAPTKKKTIAAGNVRTWAGEEYF